MSRQQKAHGSLTEQLEYWSARIAELETRIAHAKLLGYATKITELKRRLERAERNRERVRKRLHKSD